MSEAPDIRLRRLRMRSMRRGIKEMDLLLMAYAEHRLPALTAAELDLYEQLLEENDQDLYAWVSGRDAAPSHLEVLIADVRAVYLRKMSGA
ncbi:MAG: succinate dehydrogenase assembly factor 2 [Pseudomonadota bacterium]